MAQDILPAKDPANRELAMAKNLLEEALHLDENGQKVRDINLEKYHPYLQCCKAGAGGAGDEAVISYFGAGSTAPEPKLYF